MVLRVKGTQDFLDLTLFNFIITQAKKQFAVHNFTEIQTPLLEHFDLYYRSLGEYTEVVSKEMFIIEQRGNETKDRICLRPEFTASIVRAFNESDNKILPWKVFSYGPVFRYERPQKGRYRQFHQFNIEIIGSDSVSQDSYLISLLDRYFISLLGKNSYKLAINFLGCLDDRVIFTQKLLEFLESDKNKNLLCSQCLERKNHNIMRIFDCKNNQCKLLYQNAPQITDFLCTSCHQEWDTVQKQLVSLSVQYCHTPALVRGLDYYNKTVFEFLSDNLGAQDSFCGGGRYNQLAKQLGAHQDYPSVGAAIGLERLLLLLQDDKKHWAMNELPPLYVIIPVEAAQHMSAQILANSLQGAHIRIDILFDGSMKSMLRRASKMNASYVLIIGLTEQEKNSVTIKNMATGQEQLLGYKEALSFIQKNLE